MLQDDVAKLSIHTITSCTAVSNIMDAMEAQTALQQDNFVKEHASQTVISNAPIFILLYAALITLLTETIVFSMLSAANRGVKYRLLTTVFAVVNRINASNSVIRMSVGVI